MQRKAEEPFSLVDYPRSHSVLKTRSYDATILFILVQTFYLPFHLPQCNHFIYLGKTILFTSVKPFYLPRYNHFIYLAATPPQCQSKILLQAAAAYCLTERLLCGWSWVQF